MSKTTKDTHAAETPDAKSLLQTPCFHKQPPPTEPKRWKGIDAAVPADGEEETLGCWQAFSDENMRGRMEEHMSETLFPFFAKSVASAEASKSGAFSPWVSARKASYTLWETSTGNTEVSYNIIAENRPKSSEVVSTYPVLELTNTWLLSVQEISAAHGKYEGIISVQAACGNGFGIFATDFLRYAPDWNQRGLINVAISGLALHLKIFPAKPWVFTDGPRIEEAKESLRKQGKHKEADKLKEVSFATDKIRVINSTPDEEDVAEIVGRILRVRKIEIDAWKKFSGWLLEIEVLPSELMPVELQAARVLPVYAFPSALAGYIPKRDDLVQGFVWVQGKFLGKATPEQNALKSKWEIDLP